MAINKRNGAKGGASSAHSDTATSRRAPVLKFHEAAKLADKNARSIAKISQLLDIVHQPGYAAADPHRLLEKNIEKLKTRVNRRLSKLSKWSDSSADERHAEFRVRQQQPLMRPATYNRPSLPRTSIGNLGNMPYNRPVPVPPLPPRAPIASAPAPAVKTEAVAVAVAQAASITVSSAAGEQQPV